MSKNDVVIGSDDSSLVSGEELFLSSQDLCLVGCRNCVWRLAGQCPHSVLPSVGFCQELVDFITRLASPGDSVSAVWEKFSIYKARIVEAEDYRDYVELCNKIKFLEDKEYLEESQADELKRLRLDRSSAKLWWSRLNEHVVRSLQKVVDREVKLKIGDRGPVNGMEASAGEIDFSKPKQLEGDK